MTSDTKARIFLITYFAFLVVNVAWSFFATASAGNEAAIARGATSIALHGTLAFFLWKRSGGVRMFLAIAQIVAPAMFFGAEFLGSYRMDTSAHFRMGGAMAFGSLLLLWRPVRDYTAKRPNQPLQPNAGEAPFADEALPPRG